MAFKIVHTIVHTIDCQINIIVNEKMTFLKITTKYSDLWTNEAALAIEGNQFQTLLKADHLLVNRGQIILKV